MQWRPPGWRTQASSGLQARNHCLAGGEAEGCPLYDRVIADYARLATSRAISERIGR